MVVLLDKETIGYDNVTPSLTQLRSMPFRCTNKEYNKYGRISKMTFNQVWDNHIEDVIKYPK